MEANNVLADVARQLRKSCADHDVAASSWLLGRLSRPAPDEGAPTHEQWDHELRLLPHDYGGGWPQIFSMLEDKVAIELDGDAEEQARCVAQRAGELGLLDATRVEVDEHSAVWLTHFTNVQLTEYVFEEAARYRDMPVLELADELDEDPYLSTYFAAVVGMSGPDVLPDLVPAAAVLGIAAWCWRNDTAVGAWHVASDVLMARINIAVTKVIDEHVDPFDGVDWAGLQPSLTDPAWSLPDGRKVAELFGEGWPEVCDTVSGRLVEWRRLDEDVLGPEATLRLLTIGGSTSYTRHWWGQGRWPARCRTVVEDAVDGTSPCPHPTTSSALSGSLQISLSRTNSVTRCWNGSSTCQRAEWTGRMGSASTRRHGQSHVLWNQPSGTRIDQAGARHGLGSLLMS